MDKFSNSSLYFTITTDLNSAEPHFKGSIITTWLILPYWTGQASAAAAAAKSLQSCPTLCNPIDGSQPGSSVPGILQARILEWVAISFSNACMHAKSLQLCPTLCDPMDSSPPGSSVYGFSRQEYWSGLPFPSLTVSIYMVANSRISFFSFFFCG